MGEHGQFFKVAEANKGKKLSSRYHHTYNLYYVPKVRSPPSLLSQIAAFQVCNVLSSWKLVARTSPTPAHTSI